VTGLRELRDDDLPVLFEHQRDPAAVRMAAFVGRDPEDRAAFDAHGAKMRRDPKLVLRTVEVDGRVAGSVAKWDLDGEPQVTYWIGREF
jgi:hypothetical protein